GSLELFAADMMPYSQDESILAAWQPVLEYMNALPVREGDTQIMENVLQIAGQDGTFKNQAEQFGLDTTGWSWSAKFGDLNRDGFLDVYIVNGMIAAELFSHLPNNELVEENQVFRNIN